MNKTWCYILLLLAPLTVFADKKAAPIELFPLADVRLLDSPFKKAEQKNLQYLLSLNPDRLLAPYWREAGLPVKSPSYGNWESSGLDGHIGGHYVSALALMYAATGNEEVSYRLNYMLAEWKKVQEKNGNGYIGGIPDGDEAWQALAKGVIDVDNFSLNGKWVPWYNIHKVYSGLRDAHIYANHPDALPMLVKLSDWALTTTGNLTDAQMEAMLRGEYGGMNEIFVDVAELTGDDKYITLARRFSHHLLLDPLLEKRDLLTGMHANTQIPKVIGYKRIADVTGDKKWDEASRFFWETLVENRSVSIGGNSVREHFHELNNFETMISDIEGPETCNTYNMLKLSNLFYQSTGELKFIDFYERGMYNHILSSQHPQTGGLVYFTPMRPNHYRVYSQVHDGMWCCVGSGLENHGKYAELIYAHRKDQLFVNLYIPSTLQWKEKNIAITQQTAFPDEGNSVIRIDSNGRFALNLRYPSWVAPGAMTVRVNGKPMKIKSAPGEYVTIKRRWKAGDEVRVELPMTTRLESLPDKSHFYSVVHGPIVLAAKTSPIANETLKQFGDDSRMGHIASGALCPIDQAPVFVTEDDEFVSKIQPVSGKSLTFSAPVVENGKAKTVELIPFFRLHDSRYMIYWPMSSRQQLQDMQQKTALEDAARLALAKRTIDQINPGQQQPESDHFLKFGNSEMGIHQGRHWRHASDWFSYLMNDPQQKAVALQLTFFAGDAGRSFEVLVNGKKIADIILQPQSNDSFYTMDYEIPAAVLALHKDGKHEVKFVAKPGSIAGGLYYVRLLNSLE
jgi:DUF1680 family protein